MLPALRLQQLQQFLHRLDVPEQAQNTQINWLLIDQALVHPTAGPENYERLEFVGDAVVKLAAAEFLFATYPAATEGEMAAIRSILVSDRTLAAIGDHYEIERYLVMASSTSADRVGRETRLAAACEAILAALYLSVSNLSLIRPWLDQHWHRYATAIRQDPTLQNYKGALQGLTQGRYQVLPEYRVSEVSQIYGDPERFVAEVWVQGQCWGQGKGQSRKSAEQAAAQEAYLALQAL
jgi:ribonuclease III